MARVPSYFAPSAWLYRKSMANGVLGDSRFWKAIGILIIARRLFRKVMGSDPKLVALERIRPGETVVLRGVRRGNRR